MQPVGAMNRRKDSAVTQSINSPAVEQVLAELETLAARLRHRPMFKLDYGAEGYEVTVFTRPYVDPAVRLIDDGGAQDFGTIRSVSIDLVTALVGAARMAGDVADRQAVPA